MPDDFYDLLEVPEDATTGEIREAYREKAREHHPDVNEDERATTQFQVVKKAYEVLSEPEERDLYDQIGHQRYVAKNLRGLPGIDTPGPTDHSTATKPSSTYVWGDRPQQATNPWQYGQQTHPTHGSGPTTGPRRYYRTAPSHGPLPGKPTLTAFIVGFGCYAVGTFRLLSVNTTGLAAFWAALTAAPPEAILTVLLSPTFPMTSPLEYALAGLGGPALVALFPLGALVLGIASIPVALEFERRDAGIIAVMGTGPITLLALQYANERGLSPTTTAVFDAMGMTMIFLLVLPVGAVLGIGIFAYQARR